VKSMKATTLFLGACLSAMISVTGCMQRGTLTHDTVGMGPAPTAPPGGNPYGPGTRGAQALSLTAQKDLVAKLEASPRDKRAALLQSNSTTVTAIESGPDTPLKQRYIAAISH